MVYDFLGKPQVWCVSRMIFSIFQGGFVDEIA